MQIWPSAFHIRYYAYLNNFSLDYFVFTTIIFLTHTMNTRCMWEQSSAPEIRLWLHFALIYIGIITLEQLQLGCYSVSQKSLYKPNPAPQRHQTLDLWLDLLK